MGAEGRKLHSASFLPRFRAQSIMHAANLFAAEPFPIADMRRGWPCPICAADGRASACEAGSWAPRWRAWRAVRLLVEEMCLMVNFM